MFAKLSGILQGWLGAPLRTGLIFWLGGLILWLLHILNWQTVNRLCGSSMSALHACRTVPLMSMVQEPQTSSRQAASNATGVVSPDSWQSGSAAMR